MTTTPERRREALTTLDREFIEETIAATVKVAMESHPCRFPNIGTSEMTELVSEARDMRNLKKKIRNIVTEGLVRVIFYGIIIALVVGALVLLGRDAQDAKDAAKAAAGMAP